MPSGSEEPDCRPAGREQSSDLLSLGHLPLAGVWSGRQKRSCCRGLSQKYGASLTMITVRIVMRFSPVVDGVTQVSNTALQVAAFVLLAGSVCGRLFFSP